MDKEKFLQCWKDYINSEDAMMTNVFSYEIYINVCDGKYAVYKHKYLKDIVVLIMPSKEYDEEERFSLLKSGVSFIEHLRWIKYQHTGEWKFNSLDDVEHWRKESLIHS